VRQMAERILEKGGYTVIGATRASEALEICDREDQPIDLMLTDVIMPETLGTELVDKARSVRPGLRVIYMSGYSHEALAPQALEADAGSAFIEKPFTAQALLGIVSDLLDEPARGEGR
jgi:two-component system, cell cycle sensor histidine kinase and response regulator CckA